MACVLQKNKCGFEIYSTKIRHEHTRTVTKHITDTNNLKVFLFLFLNEIKMHFNTLSKQNHYCLSQLKITNPHYFPQMFIAESETEFFCIFFNNITVVNT